MPTNVAPEEIEISKVMEVSELDEMATHD